MIDYVHVTDGGRIDSVVLAYGGTLPTPAAGFLVAGYIDVTNDPDHDAIIEELMQWFASEEDDPAVWGYIPTIIRRGDWWSRLGADGEWLFIEQKAATDATVRAYLRLLSLMPYVSLDDTDTHSMRAFAAYLKATYVGQVGFWPNNGVADSTIASWFSNEGL